MTQVSLSLPSCLSNKLSLRNSSLALELLPRLIKLQAPQGGVDRLKALAIQSHPARQSDSDIGPELDPDSTNSLSHRPMGLFALLCPYELSNEAFVTSAAILLETPLPHARYLLGNMHTYSHIDVFGDFLLNNSAHASSSRPGGFSPTTALPTFLLTWPANMVSLPQPRMCPAGLRTPTARVISSRLDSGWPCAESPWISLQFSYPFGDGLRTGTCLQLHPRFQAKQSFVHGINQAIPVPCLLSRPGLCFRLPC